MVYTEEELEQAVSRVVEGGMGLRETHRCFPNIPYGTLQRHTKTRSGKLTKPGRKSALGESTEILLVQVIDKLAEAGFGLTRKEILMMAKEIDLQQDEPVFKNELPSNMWFKRFLERHNLSLRSTLNKSLARLEMETPQVRDDFFDKYENLLKKYNFQPTEIYNEDETGLQLVCKSPKTVAKRGAKYVYARKSGERSVTISVAACSNALGSIILPPFLIFKGLSLTGDFNSNNFPENTLFTHSKSGYMVTDLFLDWLRIFVENIPPKRPVLLISDGHGSHVSYAVLEFAKENEIELLCLPPHTSHALQPVDNGPFKILKEEFKDASNKRMRKMKRTLKNSDFGKFFSVAWEKICSQKIMKSGFVKTGIWPVDRSKMKLRNSSSLSTTNSTTVTNASTSSSSINVSNGDSTPSTSINNSTMNTTTSDPHSVNRTAIAIMNTITTLLQPSPQKEETTKKSRRIYTSRCLTSAEYMQEARKVNAQRKPKNCTKKGAKKTKRKQKMGSRSSVFLEKINEELLDDPGSECEGSERENSPSNSPSPIRVKRCRIQETTDNLIVSTAVFDEKISDKDYVIVRFSTQKHDRM